jgi:hypothetical protein
MKQAQRTLLEAALEGSPARLDWLKQTGNRIIRHSGLDPQILGPQPVRGLLTTVRPRSSTPGTSPNNAARSRDCGHRKAETFQRLFVQTNSWGSRVKSSRKLERVAARHPGPGPRIPGVTPAAIAIWMFS